MNGTDEDTIRSARRRPRTLVERVAEHPGFAQAGEQISVVDHTLRSEAAPRDTDSVTPESPPCEDAAPHAQIDIDLQRLADEGFLVPGSGRNRLREEFRIVKHSVLGTVSSLRKAGAWNANLVLVTSTQPREGKTFTAVNLAMSIAAEPGEQVLLVDVDPTKRGASRALDVPSRKGLLDVLHDPRLALSDVIIRTSVDGLTVVPAGQSSAASDEMLASERMENLLRRFSARNPKQILVFDSPPVLSTSQATVLSQFMGQVVFVIRAWETSQQVIRQALGLLHEGTRIGLLLNRADPKFSDAHFGSYYGSYESSS
jgi:exopolysaccharide/PEP-CTERM locus tyrosine autokinase